MKISSPCVVALTWTLKDAQGEVLDVLDEPVEFLLGGRDLLAAIETGLIDKSQGDVVSLALEPEQAFGDYDEQLLFMEPRSAFGPDLDIGMVFEGLPDGCSGHAPKDVLYFVSDLYPEHVVLDGNHPLAGMGLRLQLKVHAVRDASADETAKGTLGTGFFRSTETG